MNPLIPEGIQLAVSGVIQLIQVFTSEHEIGMGGTSKTFQYHSDYLSSFDHVRGIPTG